MKEKLEQIRTEALAKMEEAGALEKLNEIRGAYLDKKGTLSSALKNIKEAAPDERPAVGRMVNDVRAVLEDTLENARGKLARAAREEQLAREVIDVTLPARKAPLGHRHPSAAVMEEMERIFMDMGYKTTDSPEVEYDYYNFEALNVPSDHPVRDEQNAFYISDRILLRTQTAPVQIRIMEHQKPPIRVIAPGRVFHSAEAGTMCSPSSHQIEVVAIDRDITFSDLKGTLDEFMKALFGTDIKWKFYPHHYPFAKPGAQADTICFKCGGKGCRLCRGRGWIKILGGGMIHPSVLKVGGIDPEEYSGFAFGIDLERVAMVKYEIDDMRLFYENDIRFLQQF